MTELSFQITTEFSDADIVAAHAMIARSYWAENIPFEIFKKGVGNSMCFKLTVENLLVGFARVITDRASFAYLCDVFIHENYRGKKLGVSLMKAVFDCPDLQGLRRWKLATRDAHDLYAKFGFTPLSKPERFMELHRPDVYKKQN